MKKTYQALCLALCLSAFGLTSCSLENRAGITKPAKDEANLNHYKHNGKYKGCSLCNPKEEVADQPVTDTSELVLAPIETEPVITNAETAIPQETLVAENVTEEGPTGTVLPNHYFAVGVQAINRITAIGDSKNTVLAQDDRRIEPLGLAGFIIGIVGWFMPLGLGLIMCILAIIFGAISLGKIRRNPEKFRGKGFALTSLIVGIVGVGIVLLLAALLV